MENKENVEPKGDNRFRCNPTNNVVPKEEWKDILTSQYYHIYSDEIFNEQFDPKKYEPMDINPEIQLLES